jgi:hypothetical protein
MGVIQTGGIAGVASLAKGSSIKTVNDQTDYSLWEFYYDPTKDTSIVGQSGINPLNGAGQQNTGLSGATAPSTNTSTTNTSTAPAASNPSTSANPNPPQQP